MAADLARRGIRLEAAGDRLRYAPRSAVTPELRDRLRQCKPEILALLRAASCVSGSETPKSQRENEDFSGASLAKEFTEWDRWVGELNCWWSLMPDGDVAYATNKPTPRKPWIPGVVHDTSLTVSPIGRDWRGKALGDIAESAEGRNFLRWCCEQNRQAGGEEFCRDAEFVIAQASAER